MIRERSERKKIFCTRHIWKIGGYNLFFPRGGYEQANNCQYWIHWNLLPDCRINKYVIGLYYSIMNQWREFHVSAVNNIYEDWNRSHCPLVARCAWIMLRCAKCTKTFWTSFRPNYIKKLMKEFVSRKDSRWSLFWKYFNLVLIIQNVLLKWFDEWQKSTRSPANGGMQGLF